MPLCSNPLSRVDPLVSVVIPTHNRKELVLESVASVQRQTVRELEILVCDDGSTDGSREAIETVTAEDGRVRWIAGEHCGYPGTVRNRGIRVARGEWIAFQDSDDLWMETKLQKQLSAAAAKPDAQVIFSHAAALLPDGSRRRMTPVSMAREGRIFEALLLYSVIATPTVLVRRDLLLRAGLFDEEMKLTLAEDYELFLRLAADVPFAFVDEDLVLCRAQPDGLTRDVLGGLDQVERVLQATLRRFRVAEPLAAQALAKIDLRRYKHRLLGGHAKAARLADLQRSLERNPASGLARAILLAERLNCARVVKGWVQMTADTAAQVY